MGLKLRERNLHINISKRNFIGFCRTLFLFLLHEGKVQLRPSKNGPFFTIILEHLGAAKETLFLSITQLNEFLGTDSHQNSKIRTDSCRSQGRKSKNLSRN